MENHAYLIKDIRLYHNDISTQSLAPISERQNAVERNNTQFIRPRKFNFLFRSGRPKHWPPFFHRKKCRQTSPTTHHFSKSFKKCISTLKPLLFILELTRSVHFCHFLHFFPVSAIILSLSTININDQHQ